MSYSSSLLISDLGVPTYGFEPEQGSAHTYMCTMVFDNVYMPLRGLLWLAGVIVTVRGFNFSVGPAGQCDPLSVSWSGMRVSQAMHLPDNVVIGGQPPFQLLIIPVSGES